MSKNHRNQSGQSDWPMHPVHVDHGVIIRLLHDVHHVTGAAVITLRTLRLQRVKSVEQKISQNDVSCKWLKMIGLNKIPRPNQDSRYPRIVVSKPCQNFMKIWLIGYCWHRDKPTNEQTELKWFLGRANWLITTAYKKLSCRRETARRFVSLNNTPSHSRSFEMTLLRRSCMSPN